MKSNKAELTEKVKQAVTKIGYTTQPESLFRDKYQELNRLVIICPYGTPKALVEICTPNAKGVVTPSLPTTMLQAVPYYAISGQKDIDTLVANL